MTDIAQKPSLAKPRWDGSRVVFEIDVGGEAVTCAISRAALQEVSGHRHFSAADLLRCFAGIREQIEAIAQVKFTSRPDSVCGILSIWADDIDDPPASEATARPQQQRIRA
jgi:hypothetical protein